mmetsp:Transcript_33859/g.52809  ORF Transcript_33859/g.52809 Transcript_33859/m.52809 type:complete len:220 (+) Transcript_33859:3-662(+)
MQPGTAQGGNQIPDRNGAAAHAEGNNSQRQTQPLLFQRLVTEEVQELKAYGRIIENLNRRLGELERVHGDLESRLEQEARGRVQLETTLEQQEREWAMRFKELEADRDHWKGVVKAEQTKNARLIDQVIRKDQDIHRMLQRKYDNQRDSSSGGASIRNVRHMTSERQSASSSQTISVQEKLDRGEQQFMSPHDLIKYTGSMETVRIRNVQNMLNDFFGL